MKKTIIIFSLLMIACLCISLSRRQSCIDIKEGDYLRIEFIGTSSKEVLINSVNRSIGFEFPAIHKVTLKNGEYIKVRNKRTGAPFYICNDDFEKTHTNTAYAFILERYPRGKGGISNFTNTLEIYPWHMINDTIIIYCSMTLDENHGIILRTIPGDIELTPVPFLPETNELVFSKHFFIENNIIIDDGNDHVFHVEYWDSDKPHAITDKFIIKYNPIIK